MRASNIKHMTVQQLHRARMNDIKVKRDLRLIEAIREVITNGEGINSQDALIKLTAQMTGHDAKIVRDIITTYTGDYWDYEIIHKQGYPYRYFLLKPIQ